MKNETLNEIIKRKNERLEEHALKTAESIINDIVELQSGIDEATKEIAVKRAELKALEVMSVDATSILGS